MSIDIERARGEMKKQGFDNTSISDALAYIDLQMKDKHYKNIEHEFEQIKDRLSDLKKSSDGLIDQLIDIKHQLGDIDNTLGNQL